MKSIATQKGIQERLSALLSVEVFDCLPSTNAYAKQLVREGREENFLIVAREQTSGRGRFDRKFYSPKDCGVYFSLTISPSSEDELELLTPMCAVATVNAIKATLDKDTRIKWVNDIYFEGKKCVGILCEAVAVGGKISKVVLGIGVNLYEREGGANDEIKDIISFVGDGSEACADRLISGIVNELFALHGHFDARNIATAYKKLSFLLGKEVDVCKLDCEPRRALVRDIDEKCRLVVEYSDKTCEALSSGEVRIKNIQNV